MVRSLQLSEMTHSHVAFGCLDEIKLHKANLGGDLFSKTFSLSLSERKPDMTTID